MQGFFSRQKHLITRARHSADVTLCPSYRRRWFVWPYMSDHITITLPCLWNDYSVDEAL